MGSYFVATVIKKTKKITKMFNKYLIFYATYVTITP